jgi:hypothetical protein
MRLEFRGPGLPRAKAFVVEFRAAGDALPGFPSPAPEPMRVTADAAGGVEVPPPPSTHWLVRLTDVPDRQWLIPDTCAATTIVVERGSR